MIETLDIVSRCFGQRYLHRFKKFKTRTQLENWQQQQLARILREVPDRFRFYSTYAGLPFSRFPILDKQIFMKYFRDLNAFDISVEKALPVAFGAEQSPNFVPLLKGLTVGLSPGTSGHRGLFLTNQKERRQWAAQFLTRVRPKGVWKPCKIAFCLRANGNLYSTTNGRQRIQFTFFDVTQPFEKLIVNLNRYQPDILVASASLLRRLADAKKSEHLNLSPMKIISGAEVLDEQDRLWIESCFKLPVHQLYQAAEGFLGTTCDFGTLHLNEDLIYFEPEYLDRNQDRFIPIITDLFRTSQAIIRYRLNDILIKRPTPCPCGSVMLALSKVEGRYEGHYIEGPGRYEAFYQPSSSR